MLDLPPETERILEQEAAREGVSVDALLRRTFAPAVSPAADPRARVRELLARWQEQDGTPTAPPGDGSLTLSEALFSKWGDEDAHMSEAERAAQAEPWEQFQRSINAERAAAGMRPLF